MVFYFTPQGFNKIKKKIEELKGKFKKTPLSEEKAVFIDMITGLEEKVRNAEIVEKKTTNNVQIGSVVSIEMDGQKNQFTIVGKGLIDPAQGNISYESPLGAALMNKSKGEEFEAEINNKNIRFKIIEIT